MTAPVQPTTDLHLRDIHLPDPISWWPPAPGWWILLALIIFLTAGVIIGIKIYNSRALHRNVVSEIETIKNNFKINADQYELIQSLSVLLRRSCISFYPRNETAGLTGEDWLRYLDNTSPNRSSVQNYQFHQGIGAILASAPYMPESAVSSINTDALIALCESWLQAQPIKKQNRMMEAH